MLGSGHLPPKKIYSGKYRGASMQIFIKNLATFIFYKNLAPLFMGGLDNDVQKIP
jgi:hypothetical protein